MAEYYPLPVVCPECGKTMRPTHKHMIPTAPRTYFCTFCGHPFDEMDLLIRFREPRTNADRIRAMSDEELAEILCAVDCLDCPLNSSEYWCSGKGRSCKESVLNWLRQEVEDD